MSIYLFTIIFLCNVVHFLSKYSDVTITKRLTNHHSSLFPRLLPLFLYLFPLPFFLSSETSLASLALLLKLYTFVYRDHHNHVLSSPHPCHPGRLCTMLAYLFCYSEIYSFFSFDLQLHSQPLVLVHTWSRMETTVTRFHRTRTSQRSSCALWPILPSVNFFLFVAIVGSSWLRSIAVPLTVIAQTSLLARSSASGLMAKIAQPPRLSNPVIHVPLLQLQMG